MTNQTKNFANYQENYKKFWNTCDETFAHLEMKGHLKSESNERRRWHNNFLRYYHLRGAKVADYGIGGGYLGKFLFEKYGIDSYFGIDISERSLDVARRTLGAKKNLSFRLAPISFKDLGVDYFFCIACIQHFPDQNYLDEFLRNLNDSEISFLTLQIRYNTETKFTPDNPKMSCQTNVEYLQKCLSKYNLSFVGGLSEGARYQFVGLHKKGLYAPYYVSGNDPVRSSGLFSALKGAYKSIFRSSRKTS